MRRLIFVLLIVLTISFVIMFLPAFRIETIQLQEETESSILVPTTTTSPVR